MIFGTLNPEKISHANLTALSTSLVRSSHFTLGNPKKSFSAVLFIHTHTRLTALCPGLPRWAATRKVKPIWILLKQETVSGSGISWAICKSAPRSRQTTTPAAHHSYVFYRPDALPAAQPTASKHWRHVHTYFWLFTLSHIHLPTPPENVTTLTCEMQNFFIWLKACCILSNIGGSEESQLWVVVGGSEKSRLWCVATGLSGKQCHSKCSQWLSSALIHAYSLFRHWSVA